MRSTSPHLLLVGATLLALGACASQAPSIEAARARQTLNAQSPCCKSLAQTSATPLPVAPTDFKFDKHSPVFLFGNTPGYFTLFSLPAFTTPYSIDIGSAPAGYGAEMSLVMPQAQLLDANFNITRTFDLEGLRARGHGVERVIFINPGNAAERYLVVYATGNTSEHKRIIGHTNTATVVGANGFAFNVYTGNSTSTRIMASPEGTYRIQVDGLTVK